jgi:hypothetical protein
MFNRFKNLLLIVWIGITGSSCSNEKQLHKAEEMNLSGLNNSVFYTTLSGYNSDSSCQFFGALAAELKARNPEKIAHRFEDPKNPCKITGKPVRAQIMPGRYIPDSEVMQRLVDILGGKRKYPKGLDILAALGSSAAEKLLVETYHESEAWPAYSDSLKASKNQLANFNQWDKSAYNKHLQTIGIIAKASAENEAIGLTQFKSVGWQHKQLNNSISNLGRATT